MAQIRLSHTLVSPTCHLTTFSKDLATAVRALKFDAPTVHYCWMHYSFGLIMEDAVTLGDNIINFVTQEDK